MECARSCANELRRLTRGPQNTDSEAKVNRKSFESVMADENENPEVEQLDAETKVVRRMDTAHRRISPEEAKEVFKEAGVDTSGLDMSLVQRFDISDATLDRHGDRIDVAGWDLRGYKGTFLWGHRQGELPIGKAAKTWRSQQKLRQITAFASKDLYPFGHTVGRMFKAGLLQDVSVGFLPKEFKRYTSDDPEVQRGERGWGDVDFIKQELLENSAVNVGANPNAGVRDAFAQAKEMGIDTTPVADYASEILDTVCRQVGVSREYFEKLYFEHKTGETVVIDMTPEAKTEPTPFEGVQELSFTEEEAADLQRRVKELFG